ncbi:iron-sulfur cluster-binding domain-containing protein [Pseudomonas sp.]|uniref:flavin reductase family protein n=1 Tax=Pseudomonas sp. TaxID=306 RepID=UPI002CDC4425|nr:iron-sulfur cluster-binding domain-containing protein [Pseudomonas sp.]HUE93524.1 iron-sulfur cluster-binding domain-containing protein [Pseudomonas sp.]
MALLPFAWVRRLAGLLYPLRALVAHGWLRESDVDAGLALLHPALRLNRVFTRVTQRQWVADDMLELTLQANGNWGGAQPGQHLQLYLERDGVRLSRSYSLTDVQPDGRLQIAIKQQAAGRVSPYLLEHLTVDDVLELGPVYGELSWPEAQQGVLLLAAGSGITPLLGLLRAALAQGFSAPITLLHYVREQGQRGFVAELQALQAQHSNLQVRWSLTAAGAESGVLNGRFAVEHLAEVTQLDQRRVLACGPAGFVAQVQQWWQAAGLPGALQVEAFTAPVLRADVSLRQVRLGFARSHQQAIANNQHSLLEQAEAHGLQPAHGCRQGICASCTCTLLSGTVRDLRSGLLFSEPGQPIRLCVSAPHTDVEIDL